MNTIVTEKDKFNFIPPYGGNDFLNIKIDGEWIDKLLDSIYPNNDIIGTIPILSFRLETDEEEEIVWKRFLPSENSSTIAPILMCPDDCDFNCTLILAEVENTKNKILWKRIGIDSSEIIDNKEKVGSVVKWLNPEKQFEFDKLEYNKVIAEFKKQYDIDKKQYEEYCKSFK